MPIEIIFQLILQSSLKIWLETMPRFQDMNYNDIKSLQELLVIGILYVPDIKIHNDLDNCIKSLFNCVWPSGIPRLYMRRMEFYFQAHIQVPSTDQPV